MDKLHELMDEFSRIIRENYPGFSNASLSIDTRYDVMRIEVMKWDSVDPENNDFSSVSRKHLFDEYRYGGNEWRRDENQNEYLDSIGLLLKEG